MYHRCKSVSHLIPFEYRTPGGAGASGSTTKGSRSSEVGAPQPAGAAPAARKFHDQKESNGVRTYKGDTFCLLKNFLRTFLRTS